MKDLLSLTELKITDLNRDQRFSTARNYGTSVRSLLLFCEKDNIEMTEIDETLLKAYEYWLKHKNVCLNTISCYLRSLRSIYRNARDEGIVDGPDPFKNVYTGIMKTDKRALPIEEVHKIIKLDLKYDYNCAYVRDLFVFSVYACGMPFVDIFNLKKSQIINNYLVYKRHKTYQQIKIFLEPCIKQIIDKYISNPSIYIFPFDRSEKSDDLYNDYRNMLCHYNKQLKKIQKMVKLDYSLTSYSARHTWASIAYHNNVDLAIITKALGHTKSTTTLIYLKEIDDMKIDEANKKLLQIFNA